MTGGISAIKGFDYQATVILDRLFEHFDSHGSSARVHPESVDDVDLTWEDGGVTRRRHEQIKKPHEDNSGLLAPSPWSLRQVTEELLPATVRNLRANDKTQIWILGDAVAADVAALVGAGQQAPALASADYWKTLHGLAKPTVWNRIDGTTRKGLHGWKVAGAPPSDPALALQLQSAAAKSRLQAVGVPANLIADYLADLADFASVLPDVLARTSVLPSFGAEGDVRQRVLTRLEQRFGLTPEVVETTLFRNLRGFISDLSKQIDRSFDNEEFELELRSVWPHMSPLKEPVALAADHVPRPKVIARLIPGSDTRVVEVTGISGAGKTTLAAEAVAHLRRSDPKRLLGYAEVRPTTSLRDLLVGASFQLRRLKTPEPFQISVGMTTSDEAMMTRLASVLSNMPRRFLLLVDAVDGQVSSGFARDLAFFVRALTSSQFQIVVFGHERVLDVMAPYEREGCGVAALEVPGFDFEAFVALVHAHHPAIERGALYQIHRRLGKGRAAGLSAQLAQAVARTKSLAEMDRISLRPPDEMLRQAELQRFAKLSSAARPAAERLLCFALPFQQSEAQLAFPSYNVAGAIRELKSLGLLRASDDAFEMHETVRAGLESTLSTAVRAEAHLALATHYASTGQLTAQILHLEKGGDAETAEALARDAFLRGEQWMALEAFVLDHRLVTADEVVAIVTTNASLEAVWLLPDLLRALSDPTPIAPLVDLFRNDPEALFERYNRGLAIVEAILAAEPDRLRDLIEIVLARVTDDAKRESIFAWLVMSRRRGEAQLSAETLAYILARPPEVKRLLLGFLTQDGRRAALREVFALTLVDDGARRRRDRSGPGLSLRFQLESASDVTEFLAALPTAAPAAMLTAASPLFGRLATLVWANKAGLLRHSGLIARDVTAEPSVVANAIRVLAFLADPAIAEICRDLAKVDGEAGLCARIMPAVAPAFFPSNSLRRELFDPTQDVGTRMMAMRLLLARGTDPDALHADLVALPGDPISATGWDQALLLNAVTHPTPGSLHLLRAALPASRSAIQSLLVPLMTSHAELADPGVTALLCDLLGDSDAGVRRAAALELPLRRAKAALSAVEARWASEPDPVFRAMLLRVALASGAGSTERFRGAGSANHDLWRCVLAGRSRDEDFAGDLVQIATSVTRPWQLRRAAIFAAGRLPYEAALKDIARNVLGQPSPVPADDADLRLHRAMMALVSSNVLEVEGLLPPDRAGFEATLTSYIADYWGEDYRCLAPQDVARGVAWMFDHVNRMGSVSAGQKTARTLGLLATPLLQSAALRALRLADQRSVLEVQLTSTGSEWLAVKCVLNLVRLHGTAPEFKTRATDLIAASPCHDSDLLQRVLTSVVGRAVPAEGLPAASQSETPATSRVVCYEDVLKSLTREPAEFAAGLPLRLEGLTEAECARLIALADPLVDPQRAKETYVPGVRFHEGGHEVAHVRTTSTGGETGRALIRAAVAAANRWDLSNPWHADGLSGPLSSSYVGHFVDALGALDDADAFYAALARDEDVLFPAICLQRGAPLVLKHMDGRIIPYLERYLASGTDEILAGLCAIAGRLDSSAALPILRSLLLRWCGRFDSKATEEQHTENHVLWQGFRALSQNPRFKAIPGWRRMVETVLHGRLRWYHADDLMRLLEQDPRSYALVESQIFKVEDWEHYTVDEIDRLEAAAERLYQQLIEP